ncbi:monocarboxylate transporter 12-like [Mercenaria mercenaria]|uniref:monocarboxylate transporter 12-like n=1 Tax=Mercenaria mercenaria TaxID=6596 RepID=UPI00234F1785|nr:monocarboxylate transporter 12-like [Mercenaria mercenaria]XP_045173165.2 monocarboxylate transporter 12-like [Mercenaria mercenaria]
MSDTIRGDHRKSWKYHDVDKGYAWIVLIGCFVLYTFVVGSVKSYGVIYTEVVEYYSTESGETAWIGSISVILLFGLGPVANLLCKIYTFRRITFIGGILFGLGYFLSGFVTRMEYMYLTFISTGIGYGLTFTPCTTIISYYFDKRRSLANGITVSGSGVGAIALPFLYKYLIGQYGLKGTFWIIGAIFSNVCVAACILRQPTYLAEEQKEQITAENNTSDDYNVGDGNAVPKFNKGHCRALDLRFSLFKNPLFVTYVLSFMCCVFSYTASFILIPASVKTLGYDKTYVALSVTVFGGVEAVGRILIGWFADLNLIKRKYIYAVSMLIGGAFSLIAPLFENFAFIALYAAVAATFPGSFFSLIAVLIIDVVGLENFSPAFGLLSLCLTIGILPSQPAVGWLFDLYGNWHASFILTGCVYVLAGVIILLEPVVVRCSKRTDDKEPENHTQQNDRDRRKDGACRDELGSLDTSFTS